MTLHNGAPSEATLQTLTKAYSEIHLPPDMIKTAVHYALGQEDPRVLPYDALTPDVARDMNLDLQAERQRRLDHVIGQLVSQDQFGIF